LALIHTSPKPTKSPGQIIDKLKGHRTQNTDPSTQLAKSIAQRHENENIFTYLPRNWIRIELKLDLTHCRYTCHSLRGALAFCFAFNCQPLVLLPFWPHQAFSGYFPTRCRATGPPPSLNSYYRNRICQIEVEIQWLGLPSCREKNG